jgi:hypothetical protein
VGRRLLRIAPGEPDRRADIRLLGMEQAVTHSKDFKVILHVPKEYGMPLGVCVHVLSQNFEAKQQQQR